MLMLGLNVTMDQLAIANSVWTCAEKRGWSCLEKGITF